MSKKISSKIKQDDPVARARLLIKFQLEEMKNWKHIRNIVDGIIQSRRDEVQRLKQWLKK